MPRLADDGWTVHTVYVNTGGASAADRAAIAAQARAVGAAEHHEVDARAAVFDRFVRFLIQGNVLRGEVYPLSVSAERTQQVLSVVDVARAIGAGGRRARLDRGRERPGALRRRAPRARSRARRSSRRSATSASPATRRSRTSRARGLPVPAKAGAYSINRGLWGTTWGGGWTHDTWAGPPDELLEPPADAPAPREDRDRVEPGRAGGARRCRARRARAGRAPERAGGGVRHRPGHSRRARPRSASRGGSDSRPGRALVLIAAHRELEKLVLTRWQTFWKDQLGPLLRRPPARGPVFRSRAARHRGADHQLAGTGRPARRGCGSRPGGSRSSAPGARTR